jgi:hypothetical protein
MEAVALGTDAEQPLRWPRVKAVMYDGVEPLYGVLCVCGGVPGDGRSSGGLCC